MDLSFLFTIVALVISLYVTFRNYRSNQQSSSSSTPSPHVPSSSSSSSPSPHVPSSSLSYNWTHDVFPSFRGEDVRTNFLSHIHKEFQRKGITPFIDNEIKRGESIGPELKSAIRGSKIAIVLLSKNYASSKWCLDELVEIMNCREESGQIVLAIFYKVDPSEVKKLTGDFGKVFRRTCAGRSKEDVNRWSQALAQVAVIAGYHSINWDTEADMIEKIADDVSRELILTKPSSDFDGFVGIGAHMGEMKRLLCVESTEVRMIGVWGPSGIGKSTIVRALYGEYSHNFQLSVFMDNIKRSYPRPYHDVYSTQLQLQTEMLSRIINKKDIEIRHLGAVQDKLKHKRVLIVLDDVDHLVQLDALVKETRWFGPGSRIIVTSQDKGLLTSHGISHMYKVSLPADDEALQIFCTYAFGQNSPYVGFESLASEVTLLSGRLPLGLRVMGSYFRRKSKREWEMALPRLWTSLDGEIESILKFSYDALCDEDKELFIYIACFFNNQRIERMEELLVDNFSNVRYGLHVLAEKSLITIDRGWINMHYLLARSGREIDYKQSIHDPRQRLFLVDARETCQILSNYTRGNMKVSGIEYIYSEMESGDLYTNENVGERMSTNLQYLRVSGFDTRNSTHVPKGLIRLARKVRLLHWTNFPMTCLPSNFNPEFLVEIYMPDSKLEKLWEGIQTVTNLKRVNLSRSRNLKKVPDLSTATNLQELDLSGCSSLVELPSSIGNAINLIDLDLSGCSSLVKLPYFIGNAINNLSKLNLSGCSSLVKLPSSVGNASNIKELNLSGCASLVKLPSSIGNARNISGLILRGCSALVELPSSIANVLNLKNLDLTGCLSLVELPSSIGNVPNLKNLDLTGCSSLVELPSSIGNAINLLRLNLSGCASLVELPSSIGNLCNLGWFILIGCSSLVELPSSIGDANNNLKELNLSGCSSLVKLPSSIGNATKLTKLNLRGCSSLVELPSSIGNLRNLRRLILERCLKLESLPCNIELKYLETLDLTDCSLFKTFPEISTVIECLMLNGTAIEEIPSSIKSWPRLREFAVTYNENLEKFSFAFDLITELHVCDKTVRELAPWIKEMSRLEKLVVNGCTKLVSLPPLPDSLRHVEAENCESLERLDTSFHNANFGNCFKLNQEARELIVTTSRNAALPGGEVPKFFRWRATGSSLTMNWTGTDAEMMRYTACVLLVNKSDAEVGNRKEFFVSYCIMNKKDGYCIVDKYTGNDVARGYTYKSPLLREHLVIFDVEQYASCGELVFEFKVSDETCEIRECGLKIRLDNV